MTIKKAVAKLAEKKSSDKFTKRFYTLNICVSILLFLAIFISIDQFGGEAWQGVSRIGLVLPSGSKDDVGWNKSQYVAVKNICDEFDCELVVLENIPRDYESCQKALEDLSKRGVTDIYFSNGCKVSDMMKLAEKYPKNLICTIESVSALWYTGRYTILSFEGSYLAGVLAGLHTRTNKVGYIAPFPNSEINQGINAFTLGVQRVNPNAEVLLNWTGSWDNPVNEFQAIHNLKALKVDVLTYHQNSDAIPKAAMNSGINFISYNESYPQNNYYLGAIRINWMKVYRDLFRYRNAHEASGVVTLGIADNTVFFEMADKISTREKVTIESIKWELSHGKLIFSGDLFDKDGVRKCSANEAISLKSLSKSMDWLIKGVRVVGN